ncbi:MAG: hypothetical protein KDA24_21515, partial [Deltaproteobacteria bacterium]|nr:hypothetical protein [Deltaproteobacteria bacterium]
MSRLTAERRAAGRVLARFFDRPGRLDRWLVEESAGLSPDQRRRARAILYAALRNQRLIGAHLDPFLAKPLQNQRIAPRAALTLGATELLYMDAVPDRAAVDQGVELCRDLGGKGQAGFVNAVLRKLSRSEAPPQLPDREDEPLRWASIACSHPRWIVDAMASLVGEDGAAMWCATNQTEPP